MISDCDQRHGSIKLLRSASLVIFLFGCAASIIHPLTGRLSRRILNLIRFAYRMPASKTFRFDSTETACWSSTVVIATKYIFSHNTPR
jgi:hypothetical protein